MNDPDARSRFIVVDTETGGFDPVTCGLTEIAAVLVAHDGAWDDVGIEDQFCVLIRPVKGLLYNASALQVQHRTMADLQRGMLEECAVLRFYVWLRSLAQIHGFIPIYAHCKELAARSVLFDVAFILAAHERLNLGADAADYVAFPVPTDWQSSIELFKRLKKMGVHQCPSASLDTVMLHYGIVLPDEQRHTALGDCEATAYAIAAMMRDLQSADAGREQVVMAGLLGPGHE